jgi:hypothetical protein
MSQYSSCVYSMIVASQLTPAVHCGVLSTLNNALCVDLTVTCVSGTKRLRTFIVHHFRHYFQGLALWRASARISFHSVYEYYGGTHILADEPL